MLRAEVDEIFRRTSAPNETEQLQAALRDALPLMEAALADGFDHNGMDLSHKRRPNPD
jgi:hypothetical protein